MPSAEHGVQATISATPDTLASVTVMIAVDASGNVAISGTFQGDINFGSLPILTGDPNVSFDAFAAKLSSSGALTWNTFLGGSGTDNGQAIAVDGSGNVYVAGYSDATWGSPVRAYTGGADAFAAKLNSSGALSRSRFAPEISPSDNFDKASILHILACAYWT